MKVRSLIFGPIWGCVYFLLLSITSVPPALADPSKNIQSYTNNPLVAIVDGEPIMMNDIKSASIHDAMDRLHKLQESALKDKTLQILSKKHPEFRNQKPREVTPKDIENFYYTTPGVKELGTLEQMRHEIRQYLEDVFHENHVEKNYQLALKKGWAKIYLKPPSEFRLVADIGSAMRWFDNDDKVSRKVYLLEFSDFQCPFCKRVQPTLAKLRKRFAGQVQFGYRHFPLPFHKEAQGLAEAVECAREQGRFWELHSLFYKLNGSTAITRDRVILFAERAGIKSIPEFQKCWTTGKHREQVLNDIRKGGQLGIQGTPAFVLGIYDKESNEVVGEMLSGAVSEEKFNLLIEKYLSISRAEAKLVR